MRWEQNREAMAAALARHDELIRTALEARRAYVFKTIGDAFCAAFATAPHAIAAALDAQRALAAEDFSAINGLRVRMALHTGIADERDGDYFGPTVNRVARLLAIGHGGQVLVSGTTADLLQHEMPPQASLRDLGAHRLKDLAHPERVYQLLAPDLPETFPTLLSLNYLSNNLPAQLTSFLGRDEVVSDIKTLLNQHRLVTLAGTGGSGKTRCAIQVGAELVDRSGDGVWLAELAPISDASLVPSVIARALSLQEQPNRPMLDTLLAYLKRRRLLIILDNCEHVIDEARRVCADILHECPEVRVLATSREPLNISGEEAYRMPSLPVPLKSGRLSAEEASRYGAVQLFSDRALSADKRFVLSDESAPYVAEICRRLDGIPLAIELAAARVKVVSPKQLAQMLDERFRVLNSGDRSALPRHQTMRALIDWSYDLLSDEEQTLFRKLSIFAGGCTLRTATEVCGGGDEIVMLEWLSSLVDKSLLQVELSASETRYELLESVRQYGCKRLDEHGEYAMAARAHASVFLSLADDFEQIVETMPDRAWEAQSEPELENWRAALAWALGTRGDVAVGRRLLGALRPVWVRFAAIEGRQWVRLAAQGVDDCTDDSVVAALALAEASLDAALSQYRACFAAAERALACYRRIGDARGVALAKRQVGLALLFLGRITDGEALLQSELDIVNRLGLRRTACWILAGLALARQLAGDVSGARPRLAEALATAQAAGFEHLAAQIANDRAELEFRSGDALTALRLVKEALDASRELNTAPRAHSLHNSASYLVALGRYDEARSAACEALTLSRDLELEVLVAFALQHQAAICGLRPRDDSGGVHDDRVRAALLLGFVDAHLAALQATREYTEQQEYDKLLPTLRDALGDDELQKLMTDGSAWGEDRAVAEAMLV